jgi:phosphatidylserine synthase
VPTSHYYVYALMGLVAVLSILMVSTIRYTSAKSSSSGRPAFLMVIVIAAVGMAVWLFSEYMLLGLAAAYVSHGVIWWLVRPLFVRSQPAASN